MATMEEEGMRATPAIGIALILLGVLLVLKLVDLEIILGIGAIVIGVLVLIGEFA